MKRVRVEIPFHLKATKTDHKPGDILTVDEETLARIQAVNINMVTVLCEAKRKARKPKE